MATLEQPAPVELQNPASPEDLFRRIEAGEVERVPMSVPRQKLQVPALSGFHLYWMLEENVGAAFRAGYQMVKTDELSLLQMNVATAGSVSGNMDMGTNISALGNKPSSENGGRQQMLYLMKLKEEWFRADQRKIAERNAGVMNAVFRGEKIIDTFDDGETKKGTNENADDKALRYVDRERSGPGGLKTMKPLFNRPARKGSTTN
jgi:hypothetical protein